MKTTIPLAVLSLLIAWCGYELRQIRIHLESVPTVAEWESGKFSPEKRKAMLARTPRLGGDFDGRVEITNSLIDVEVKSYRPVEVEVKGAVKVENASDYLPMKVQIVR